MLDATCPPTETIDKGSSEPMSRRALLAATSVATSGAIAGMLAHSDTALASSAPLIINVAEYGTLGTANDTTVFQKAFKAAQEAGGAIVECPAGSYNVTDIKIKGSGITVWFPGVTLVGVASSASNVMNIQEGANDVLVFGVTINGNDSAAYGITVESARCRISRVHVYNFTGSGIAAGHLSTHVTIDHCRVEGSPGGLVIASGHDVLIYGNHVSYSSVGITGGATRAVIADNFLIAAGEHTETSGDAITFYNTVDSYVVCAGNMVWNSVNNGIHLGGSNLAVVGNELYKVLEHGIQIRSHNNEGITVPGSNFIVSDNIIDSPTDQMGIWIQSMSGGIVAHNEIVSPHTHGIELNESSTISVYGNTIRNPVLGFGICLSGSQRIAVCANAIYDAPEGSAIFISKEQAIESSNIAVTGNVAENNAGGITVLEETQGVAIADNVMVGNRGFEIWQSGPAGVTNGNYTDTAISITAASELIVQREARVIEITGSTTITSISASTSEAGKRLVIRFLSTCTVLSGNNLVLASEFKASANSVLSLACDGSSWYETSRSSG